ncbi:hypothetical protein INR49_008017 [Caranx melampygus]|nr:hypothetical protein INR49_008017 [Caranx melampygus]
MRAVRRGKEPITISAALPRTSLTPACVPVHISEGLDVNSHKYIFLVYMYPLLCFHFIWTQSLSGCWLHAGRPSASTQCNMSSECMSWRGSCYTSGIVLQPSSAC